MRQIGLIIIFCSIFLPVYAQKTEPAVVLLPNSGKENHASTALLNSAQQGLQNSNNEERTVKTAQGVITTGSTAKTESNPPAWSGYHAAESMATNGNPDLALKQLEARLISEPNDAKAAYLKGLILMQLGKAEDAERWFKMMQSNFPDLPQPYNALAVIYTGRDDFRSAQTELEALLEKQPSYHNARINLASVHLKMATENYRLALENRPKDKKIAEILHLLETLK